MPNVYDASIQPVGRVEEDGHVYDRHATLIGAGAQVVGTVDPHGRLSDAAGQPVGEVWSDGGVFTWLGQYVGYVETTDDMPLGLKGGRPCSSCRCGGPKPAPQRDHPRHRALSVSACWLVRGPHPLAA